MQQKPLIYLFRNWLHKCLAKRNVYAYEFQASHFLQGGKNTELPCKEVNISLQTTSKCRPQSVPLSALYSLSKMTRHCRLAKTIKQLTNLPKVIQISFVKPVHYTDTKPNVRKGVLTPPLADEPQHPWIWRNITLSVGQVTRCTSISLQIRGNFLSTFSWTPP